MEWEKYFVLQRVVRISTYDLPLTTYRLALNLFMPIYEYKCKECGEHFERRQTVNEGPLTLCEKCGGALEKQWSLSGFQFKGAGWYVTDYAAKGTGKDSKAAEKSEKGSGSESTDSSGAASKVTSEPPPAPKKESGSKKE